MPKKRETGLPQDGAPAAVEPPGVAAPERETLDVEVTRLIASGKAALGAEIAFQALRAVLAGRLVARMAGLVLLVLAVLFFVLMALVVGGLMALGPVLGVAGAVGVVVLVLLGLAGVAVLGLWLAWRRLRDVLFGGGSAP